MSYDTIRDELGMLDAERCYSDFGALAVRHAREIIRALTIADNVEAAELRADLECGHVVAEARVVTTADDVEVCEDCAARMERGGRDD